MTDRGAEDRDFYREVLIAAAERLGAPDPLKERLLDQLLAGAHVGSDDTHLTEILDAAAARLSDGDPLREQLLDDLLATTSGSDDEAAHLAKVRRLWVTRASGVPVDRDALIRALKPLFYLHQPRLRAEVQHGLVRRGIPYNFADVERICSDALWSAVRNLDTLAGPKAFTAFLLARADEAVATLTAQHRPRIFDRLRRLYNDVFHLRDPNEILGPPADRGRMVGL